VTIRAINDGPHSINHAAITATLPISLAGPGGSLVTWYGSLQPGEGVTQTFTVTPTASGAISLPVIFQDVDRQLAFTSLAQVAVDVPFIELNLSPSSSTVFGRAVMTWTLTVHNRGADWPAGQIIGLLPFDQVAISDTVTATFGAAMSLTRTVMWQGALPSGQAVTVTYQMTAPFSLNNQRLYGSAVVIDDAGIWQTGAWVNVQPRRAYLPLVRK
jgi:hypothetical protein